MQLRLWTELADTFVSEPTEEMYRWGYLMLIVSTGWNGHQWVTKAFVEGWDRNATKNTDRDTEKYTKARATKV